MVTTVIIIAVVAVIILAIIGMYNNLVKLRNNRENAFADIDVQLKQRFDLVPQLVATVKGYATHEKELLENITAARTAGVNATSIDDKIKADQQLTSALAGLKVQVEAYPDLKANQNFMQLQGELADIESLLPFVATSTLLPANSTTLFSLSQATSLLACSDSTRKPCTKSRLLSVQKWRKHLKSSSKEKTIN